jgi:hypothetical protein
MKTSLFEVVAPIFRDLGLAVKQTRVLFETQPIHPKFFGKKGARATYNHVFIAQNATNCKEEGQKKRV